MRLTVAEHHRAAVARIRERRSNRAGFLTSSGTDTDSEARRRGSRLLHVLLLPYLTLATALPAAAQHHASPRPSILTEVPRLPGTVTFDGIVEEAAWEALAPLPLVQQVPTFGGPLSERTELRIAYDDRHVYLAARCYDSGRITETSFKRDDWGGSDDQVAITLDTFNDHENALVFVLYPTGARIDAAISNDGRSLPDANLDWNTFWDGKTSRDEKGWYAEMRIPISSLRFEAAGDGRVRMGVLAYRYIARLQELQIFPEVPPNWGFWSFVKPSRGHPVTFEGLQARRPFYVTPYAIAGFGQDARLNEDGSAYVRSGDPVSDVGLDLKYGLMNNLTLDVTLNTDFAQVEADNQEVNLTRFSLFFPEKRQFFLERTSTFDFSFGGFDRLFYSRRIGLDEGRAVRLLGGARLVGRIDPWDAGLLSMQSARDGGRPSENFGVLRLKRQVLNANSYVGGIGTSRIEEDGDYHAAYGLDGVINVTGDDYVRFNWAQTFDARQQNRLATLDNSRLRLLWQRARETGLGYDLGISRAGAAYRPELGFQLRQDFTQLVGNVGMGWRPAAPSPVASHRLLSENSLYLRNRDSEIETAEVKAAYNVGTRRGHVFTSNVVYTYDDLLHDFHLSDDAGVPAGRYRFVTGSLGYQMPSGRLLRTDVQVGAGSFYDGRQASLNLSPTWSLSPRVELSGTYSYNRVRFPGREQAFDAHLVRGRAELMLNTKVTLSTFVQYNRAIDVVLAYVRFRFNPREGNDFFLVYSEVFHADRPAMDPVLPFSSSRTIIAKYTHTFLW